MNQSTESSRTDRINRSTYVVSLLACYLVIAAGALIDLIIYAIIGKDMGRDNTIGAPFTALASIAAVIAAIRLGVLRLHDTDASGWWLLGLALPFVSLVILFQLFFSQDKKSNKYGDVHRGTYFLGKCIRKPAEYIAG